MRTPCSMATLRFSVPMVSMPMNAPVRRSFAPSTRLALSAVASPAAVAEVMNARRFFIRCCLLQQCGKLVQKRFEPSAVIVVECRAQVTGAGICENGPLRFTWFLAFFVATAAYGQSPATASVYRLDDRVKSAVPASGAAPIAETAPPIVWKNFLSEDDITWNLLRGRIGYRKGDLIVKGEGSTPVIVSPDAQPIDWSLYEAVEIRMLAEGGDEIKIRIGDAEFKQPIGGPNQYHDYRF